ncbi:tripartite tricarboxylate transporter TctB family protein [Chelativorans salis]|uniref:Tripartite tricarboxylate transporter TctB family protein n=1 Tax=Chelativorans salis TaxID=2978478 RepID=A0ABT2LQD3_9HYPH|nr:tripartite tricarboxylate transporter TctB family protein [Chelativorans sp. EGI FJ00035]MCT7376760.1 tripartite tricarboxylate transporter TctB family protein [Chelativorans sp. EGI FJ00035]
MQPGQGRLVVMWGHLALLAVIAGVVVAYWMDARATSLKVNNLLLVQPASVLALMLVALVVPQCFKRTVPGADEEVPAESLSDLGKVAALAACFGAFTTTLEIVGFDVATFLFMIAALFICGERRWWLNLSFSAAFTMLLIYGYGALIPFPFPLTVL